ncbi:hypothetical protein [Phyllobacterium myrsinacearum]|uniref:EF-hand domain-containing protein n=1 Tax=Phyllobacterium myrsinacearum TaxID=28101 RepID=A0A839EIU8_9HYPH|nr:hypothetical protein [Phyllobacterium myrsinacearum]MBA8877464.1 hypothetical protein [Phyllobacterium myrsinacearum]
MKHSRPLRIAILASVSIFTGIVRAMANDDIGHPPPDPAGTVYPEMTPEFVQQKVDEQIRAQFEQAAGPSAYVLSAEQAKTAGWGVIADHFPEIDRDRDGYVSLSDIVRFLAARTPQNLMKAAQQRQSQKSGVEIIE